MYHKRTLKKKNAHYVKLTLPKGKNKRGMAQTQILKYSYEPLSFRAIGLLKLKICCQSCLPIFVTPPTYAPSSKNASSTFVMPPSSSSSPPTLLTMTPLFSSPRPPLQNGHHIRLRLFRHKTFSVKCFHHLRVFVSL